MLTKHTYCISDLHLGGALPTQGDIGFQMCPTVARQRLAGFINYVSQVHADDGITQLIINGDFIDFLAEKPITDTKSVELGQRASFESFTENAQQATEKLKRVIHSVDEGAPEGKRVFDALEHFVQKGHQLTIILGNHDIELSLQPVRRMLIERLTQGHPSLVEFIYDGEAYIDGNIIAEHGNRYDGWNAVDHGALRAYRSALTRNESCQGVFTPPPGSRLVAQVMNQLKTRYKFIDLLKPENEALIPILVALEPEVLKHLWAIAPLVREQHKITPPVGRPPKRLSYISAETPSAETLTSYRPQNVDQITTELLQQAEEEWGSDAVPKEATQISGGQWSWLDSPNSLWRIIKEKREAELSRYKALRRAFVSYRKTLDSPFDHTQEAKRYLEAAKSISGEAGRIVLLGHTHLPKCIRLNHGVYLNSGTWCPIIRLPKECYDPDEPEGAAVQILQDFIRDLAHNVTERWCELHTTCIYIRRDEASVTAELIEVTASNELQCIAVEQL